MIVMFINITANTWDVFLVDEEEDGKVNVLEVRVVHLWLQFAEKSFW